MPPSATVKVYLDTNVIISGLLSDEGYPARVLDISSLRLPSIRAVTGEFNIAEIKRNIKRKLPALEKPFMDALKRLNIEVVPFPDAPEVEKLGKIIASKDAPVLAGALLSGSAYLITGDKHFRTEKMRSAPFKIKVVSPAEFIEKILPALISSPPPADD